MNGLVLLRRLLSLGIFLFLLGGTSLALEIGQDAGGLAPVTLEADHLTYDKASDTYHASGRVKLQKGHLTLLSDSVQWSVATGDAVALGNVQLTEPEGSMDGEELSFNLDSGRGRLKTGKVFFKEHNFHIAGAEIEKLGEQTYRVMDGTFTTCDGEIPSWKFSTRQCDVSMGQYAQAKHVFFYIRDFPVLYFPYIIYPVKTERQSGFLMPRFGYSKKRGTQLSLGYYQVIARNMDATFLLDYLSNLGVGKGIEYRYIFGEDNEGTLRGCHISGLKDADDRYALAWQHQGTLPKRVCLSTDVEYVSSKDYFEDFGEVAEEYNKDKAQSVISLSRKWGKLNLTGQLKYIKDLEQDNDQTLQRLPEIKLAIGRKRLGKTPFYFDFDSTSTYFWRREGMKGERLNVRPSFSAVFLPGAVLEITPEIGYRERLYWASQEGPGYEREGLYDLSTRISTRFSRVFHLNGRALTKIQHSIEPEIDYSYIPDDEQVHLPYFDAQDRIAPENKISYGLVNRLIAKFEPEGEPVRYHEFLYLRLSQNYDIRQERCDIGGGEPFSEIRTELVVRPSHLSFIDVDTRYDPHERWLDTFNISAGVTQGEGNRFSLDYRYSREEYVEYVAVNLDTALLKPVYMNYQNRYDVEGRRTLENVLNLEYRAQCWSVYLTCRIRPEDREYLVTFNLTGLGKVAQFGGSLGN